jgi:L-lactate dehydrogenase complex protein LldE
LSYESSGAGAKPNRRIAPFGANPPYPAFSVVPKAELAAVAPVRRPNAIPGPDFGATSATGVPAGRHPIQIRFDRDPELTICCASRRGVPGARFPGVARLKIGFLVTCLADLMRPSIPFAAIRLLELAGAEVVVPPTQTCCGQPAYNSGDRKSAQAVARKVLDEFAGFDYVVAPSGSCAGMIRAHYPELFREFPADLARANELAARTYELTDFLVNVAKLDAVPGRFDGSITYHDSCAGLRELGVFDQPRALLAKVPGLKLTEMVESTQCCGFGGTFSIKFGDISAAIADRKCGHIAAAGADAVVGGDLGCLLNIEGRLRRRGDLTTRVLHVAEVLAGEEDQG